jgi:hypothetical protein
LYEKWERKKRDLFYLLKINPLLIISQIDEIESQLLLLNNIQKYSEKLLKEERLVYFIYKIFVELKLIKHIGYVEFSNQFLGNEIMTLEKEQKKTEISLMQSIALQMICFTRNSNEMEKRYGKLFRVERF